MFQRLPSPSALRTFEAAARLGSFKAAAEELGVTPTAVSHQVRALEESLGAALFVRRTRAIELTEAGAALSPAVHQALNGIRTALEDLALTQSTLTITTTPAFAALRLAPMLADFERRHPGLRTQLTASPELVDLRRDRRVDVAIRYATGPHPGLTASPLLQETFAAFAAPGRFSPDAPLDRSPLIETRAAQPLMAKATWAHWGLAWAQETGQAWDPNRLQVTRFDEEHYALQAALAGQGVALLSTALVGDTVARGWLAPLHPNIRLPGGGYTALCAPDRAGARKIRLFLAWLREAFSLDAPPSGAGA